MLYVFHRVQKYKKIVLEKILGTDIRTQLIKESTQHYLIISAKIMNSYHNQYIGLPYEPSLVHKFDQMNHTKRKEDYTYEINIIYNTKPMSSTE